MWVNEAMIWLLEFLNHVRDKHFIDYNKLLGECGLGLHSMFFFKHLTFPEFPDWPIPYSVYDSQDHHSAAHLITDIYLRPQFPECSWFSQSQYRVFFCLCLSLSSLVIHSWTIWVILFQAWPVLEAIHMHVAMWTLSHCALNLWAFKNKTSQRKQQKGSCGSNLLE